jgi:hypothetical protein
MRQAAAARGLDLPVEDPPELPQDCLHVWSWFLDLHHARASGGMGPAPITYESIVGYAALTGTTLRPWEVHAIKAVDDVWLAVMAETAEERRRRKEREGKAKARSG